jgi:hypothetical protein
MGSRVDILGHSQEDGSRSGGPRRRIADGSSLASSLDRITHSTTVTHGRLRRVDPRDFLPPINQRRTNTQNFLGQVAITSPTSTDVTSRLLRLATENASGFFLTQATIRDITSGLSAVASRQQLDSLRETLIEEAVRAYRIDQRDRGSVRVGVFGLRLQDPNITHEEMASALRTSKSNIDYTVRLLRQRGYLERRERRLPDTDERRLAELVAAGATLRQIGKEFGIEPTAAAQRKAAAGLTSPKKRVPDHIRKGVLETLALDDSPATIKQLASAHQLAPRTIELMNQRRREELGLPRRRRGRPPRT